MENCYTFSKRIGIILLAFLLISLSLTGCTSNPGKQLTVYAFSAGAADAFLITTEHSAILIDCAEKEYGEDIVNYLVDCGITQLDYLIITHFDKDHVGGAKKVIENVMIDHVLQSNVPKESSAYDNYLEALLDAGIEAETVTENLSFDLDGVHYWINPPAGGYSSDESNNSSLIVSVTNGKDSFLFMGDAEDERITEFLNMHRGTYDFLKVPHHGRSGDMSSMLIQSVRPEIAVVTSSYSEMEDGNVIHWLEQLGTGVFLTRKGAVIIESTGNGVSAHYTVTEQ